MTDVVIEALRGGTLASLTISIARKVKIHPLRGGGLLFPALECTAPVVVNRFTRARDRVLSRSRNTRRLKFKGHDGSSWNLTALVQDSPLDFDDGEDFKSRRSIIHIARDACGNDGPASVTVNRDRVEMSPRSGAKREQLMVTEILSADDDEWWKLEVSR